MTENTNPAPSSAEAPTVHRRRPRYAGKYPRGFDEKYKERDPVLFGETVAKVIASGKTPAGTHRPILVAEILGVLEPRPGEVALDCTLGYGGHAESLLPRLLPGGRLVGIDTDPIQLPKTEERLRALGFGADVFSVERCNFAGLPQVLARVGVSGADVVLSDLGVSSMQIDDPTRGFSVKFDGPLDMRMNPERGQPVSAFLERVRVDALSSLLVWNSDEPHAAVLAPLLAGKKFSTTRELATAVRAALPRARPEEVEVSVRRVFQALRIAVNDEFSALETWLRHLPACLNAGGRVAVLTFHSGEDRRVKRAFESGLREGVYSAIAVEVIRPGPEERRANPRSTPAKLRWARR